MKTQHNRQLHQHRLQAKALQQPQASMQRRALLAASVAIPAAAVIAGSVGKARANEKVEAQPNAIKNTFHHG